MNTLFMVNMKNIYIYLFLQISNFEISTVLVFYPDLLKCETVVLVNI